MLQFLSVIGTTLLATLLQKFWTSSPHNVVDLGYVKYQGNLSFTDTVAYLGIPYAEPPIRSRRFRAPVPLNTTRITHEAGGEIVDAMAYPDFCVQAGIGGAGGAGSEDCLRVNVYAPAKAKPGDNLPVLVYFHGGGYIIGNPHSYPFDHWIHQSPNVVIVSVYYRLFAFGFLALPEFRDPSLGDFNAGFQDQIQALKFVQNYISAFGGDPKKVTISGHSAGAGSVQLHLVARVEGQLEEELFSKAILQSVYRTPVPLPEQQQPLFDFFADKAGCGSGSAIMKLDCLRKASVSSVAQAQDAVWSFNHSYNMFRPVVDDRIITASPTTLLLNGHFAKVPVLVGATTDESYYGFGQSGTVESSLQAIFPGLRDDDITELAQIYPASDFSSATQQIRAAIAEPLFTCGTYALGGVFANATKAWVYRFDQGHPTGDPSLGVMHTAENWYMMLGTDGTGPNGTTTLSPMTPTDTAFGEELIAFWISFIRTGNPNIHKLERSPDWVPYYSSDEKKQRMLLKKAAENSTAFGASGSFMEEEDEAQARRCALVIGKAEKAQN